MPCLRVETEGGHCLSETHVLGSENQPLSYLPALYCANFKYPWIQMVMQGQFVHLYK